jgi:hypothetical protein
MHMPFDEWKKTPIKTPKRVMTLIDESTVIGSCFTGEAYPNISLPSRFTFTPAHELSSTVVHH